MGASTPTALFVVQGSRPISVKVSGVFDAGAVVGFDAVMNYLVGNGDVVLDLTGCDVVDEPALQAVARSAERIVGAGNRVSLVPPQVAPEAAPVPVGRGTSISA